MKKNNIISNTYSEYCEQAARKDTVGHAGDLQWMVVH